MTVTVNENLDVYEADWRADLITPQDQVKQRTGIYKTNLRRANASIPG